MLTLTEMLAIPTDVWFSIRGGDYGRDQPTEICFPVEEPAGTLRVRLAHGEPLVVPDAVVSDQGMGEFLILQPNGDDLTPVLTLENGSLERQFRAEAAESAYQAARGARRSTSLKQLFLALDDSGVRARWIIDPISRPSGVLELTLPDGTVLILAADIDDDWPDATLLTVSVQQPGSGGSVAVSF